MEGCFMYIDYKREEINLFITYYGAALAGRTTNIKYLHDTTPKTSEKNINFSNDKLGTTIYCNFIPHELGTINGYQIRLHLQASIGKKLDNPSKNLQLFGVDGIVFVADSQSQRWDANIESFSNLTNTLNSFGIDLAKLPFVLQLNKRDLSTMAVSEVTRDIYVIDKPVIEAVAYKGIGVFDTLKSVVKQILIRIKPFL
jgi:signal recognition particle receptor subunit beta